MKKKLSIIGLFGLALILGNCSKEEDETVDASFNITSITPQSGPVGTAVAIVGVGFSTVPSENVVKFNGVEANVLTSNETTIAVMVPANATTGAVTVTKGSKTANGPTFTVTESPTQAYYIKFKANGVSKTFDSGNPGYQSCGQCACSYMPVLDEDNNANLSVCNDNSDWITSADIQGWNGDKIAVNAANFPTASFDFTEDGEWYSTENVANQTGSEIHITSVVADGNFGDKQMFKVTGTFKGKVAKSGGPALDVTEGTFVIRYSED